MAGLTAQHRGLNDELRFTPSRGRLIAHTGQEVDCKKRNRTVAIFAFDTNAPLAKLT
jgi:hypothetical protein